MCGEKNSCKACASEKKILQTSVGLTSVYDSYNLLLKLDKLGFQLSKQGRQELPGLKLQSMIVILDKLWFQPSKQGRQEFPGLKL